MKKEKYEKKLLKELGNNFKLQLMTCVVFSVSNNGILFII